MSATGWVRVVQKVTPVSPQTWAPDFDLYDSAVIPFDPSAGTPSVTYCIATLPAGSTEADKFVAPALVPQSDKDAIADELKKAVAGGAMTAASAAALADVLKLEAQ